MAVDVSIRIGGKAGQGMQAISSTMGKIFTRQGYWTFIHQDVESRIRGGHNYAQIRIKDEPLCAVQDTVHLLIALDPETVEQDRVSLVEQGILIFDSEGTHFRSDNPHHVPVPMERLAREAGGSQIMMNSVATGAALALMGQDLQPLLDHLEEEFRGKGKEVAEKNKNSARAGYLHVQQASRVQGLCAIPPRPRGTGRLLLSGSHAMALGAICSGLKFYSGYPMSPSTPIMETVASKQAELNIILEPAEDEIAAIHMAIGASFAGVRAMTATSGGGFCLMVEALGLAGMTETPVVVVVAQRGGPSTGLPTRTEQADLRFVMHASQGEVPRAILAPGHAEQAFYAMGKAFNIAERYQIPVIVLGDQHLNDSFFTVEALDPLRIPIDRGEILSNDAIPSPEEYRRYAITPSGISPRILPGQSKAVLCACSDEHTEEGHISESAEVRRRMMEKRMRKIEGLRQEMAAPELYPEGPSQVLLLGWGSTFGALQEATALLNREGLRTGMLHFCEIHPFPPLDFLKSIDRETRIFAVESNYTGQFADWFHAETGLPIFGKILKYDGRPFSPQEIAARIRERM